MLNYFKALIALAVSLFTLQIHADEATTIVVPGTAAPWQYVNGGLNTNYQYGFADDTTALPAVASGLALAPGDTVTLSYVDGSWNSGGWTTGPDGSPPYQVFNSPADAVNGAGVFPAQWCPQSEFPMNAFNMMAVFTDTTGSIIGTPHAINYGDSLIVPEGAANLQLGMDDNGLYDNGGAITMSAIESPVPSPSSAGLAAVGVVALGLLRRRAA